LKKLILIVTVLLLSADIVSGQGIWRKRQTLNYDWKPGIVNILDFGYSLWPGGTSSDFRQSYGITNITGYQFDSNHIKAGIGYGLWKSGDNLLVPLFVNSRFNITSDFQLPFISASGGVAFSPDDILDRSKIFFNPEIGVRILVRSKMSFNLSSGVLVQSGGSEGRETFISFKMGFEFKGGEIIF
jgi:hypothetical protein